MHIQPVIVVVVLSLCVLVQIALEIDVQARGVRVVHFVRTAVFGLLWTWTRWSSDVDEDRWEVFLVENFIDDVIYDGISKSVLAFEMLKKR